MPVGMYFWETLILLYLCCNGYVSSEHLGIALQVVENVSGIVWNCASLPDNRAELNKLGVVLSADTMSCSSVTALFSS